MLFNVGAEGVVDVTRLPAAADEDEDDAVAAGDMRLIVVGAATGVIAGAFVNIGGMGRN